MPNKTFSVMNYVLNAGYKNSATWGGVSIRIQGYLACFGADGSRFIVYGLHPSSVRERLASIGVAFRRRGQYDRTHLKKEPPIDWSAAIPSFAEWQQQMWRDRLDLSDRDVKITFARVNWEQLMHNAAQPRYREAIQTGKLR